MIIVEEVTLPEKSSFQDIDWGKEFEEFDDKRKIRYLKKFSSAMNHAADVIQKERDALLKEFAKQVKLVEHADEATSIQKSIVIKAITDFNAEKQELIKRIQELEGIVRTQDKLLETYNHGNNGKLEH